MNLIRLNTLILHKVFCYENADGEKEQTLEETQEKITPKKRDDSSRHVSCVKGRQVAALTARQPLLRHQNEKETLAVAMKRTTQAETGGRCYALINRIKVWNLPFITQATGWFIGT